jgi:glycosyltransferase involved in cell wall biosynthesis
VTIRRLGYFLYTPRVGGAERYVRDLLHGVDRARYEPVLLYGSWPALDRYLRLDDIEHVGVPIHELGARIGNGAGTVGNDAGGETGSEVEATVLRRLVRTLPASAAIAGQGRTLLRGWSWRRNADVLTEEIATARLDVLHVVNGGYPGATSALSACIAGPRTGVPTVMTVCSTAYPRQSPRSIERRIDRRVAASVDAVVVPGGWPATALVDRRGFPPAKLVTIPWGVEDVALFDRAACRRALDLPVDGTIIGTLANFTGAKGHDLLLRAFSRLERSEELHLVLAGEGPQRADVMRLAESLGVGERVRFPGRVDDSQRFCRALDLFVLASDIEGLPYVVLEAMSQGIPVIASDVGAMGEAVEDGATGTLIQPRDVDGIHEAVVRMLDDPDVRRAMGDRGRQRFVEHFSISRMVGAHEDLYDRVGGAA